MIMLVNWILPADHADLRARGGTVCDLELNTATVDDVGVPRRPCVNDVRIRQIGLAHLIRNSNPRKPRR
jgi:hypothetical protein